MPVAGDHVVAEDGGTAGQVERIFQIGRRHFAQIRWGAKKKDPEEIETVELRLRRAS